MTATTATTATLLPRRLGPAAPLLSLSLSLVLAASAVSAMTGCGSPDDAPRATPELSGPVEPPPPPRPSPGVDLDGPIPLPERGGPVARGGSKVPVELTADRALLPVAVPRPPRGGSVGFAFDGDRRGWVASLPEGQQLPTVAYGGDRVYVSGGFQSVSFYALHATTGRVSWATTNLEDNGPTSAVFDDGRVIFNTESCTLFALDARTGKRLWLRWLGDPTLAQTAVADGLVFAAHRRTVWSSEAEASSLPSGDQARL
jgi:Ca-activated chloride channel family protein